MRDWPFGSHVVGDFAHRGHQNGTLEGLRFGFRFGVDEVDEEGDCGAHGLAVEEGREVRVLGSDGIEEGEAIVCGEVYVRDVGFEALGVAVALEV